MNLAKLFNQIVTHVKWSAAHAACLTMVFAPVAYGLEAEKLSQQQLTSYVQEFGLNKKTTLGEFWQKSKAYYPGHVYKELEAFVQLNKNLEMPQIELTTSKSTNGDEVPVLQVSQNGKTNRIQFFGENQKWAKLNNTNLSAADLERPEDIFKRMVANDIKFKTEYDQLGKKSQGESKVLTAEQISQEKDLARFQSFPRVNPVMWKSMTFEQRASFIVKMRLMYMSAQQVLDSAESKTNEKTSSKNFLQILLGADAYAASKEVKTKLGKVTVSEYAKNCIVAGYNGAEGERVDAKGIKRKVCSLDVAQKMYDGATPPNYVRNANIDCISSGNNFRACNPAQYGFPNGKPICIDQNKAEFQTATHRNNICDNASPLSSAKLVMEFAGKDYSNVMPASKRQKMIEDDQRTSEFKYTKDFVQGILLHTDEKNNSGDKTISDMFKNGVWSLELDKQLVEIQQSYEVEINKAIESCHQNVALKQVDKNQKGACDQLHRRWLFTEKFIADLRSKACPEKSVYIGAYDKDEVITESKKSEINKKQLSDSDGKGLCKCADGETTSFKGQCKGAPAVAIVPPIVSEKKLPDVIDKSCPSGAINFQPGITVSDNKCQCEENKDKLIPQSTPPEKVEKLCSKSNLWKWILGGAAALILLGIFHRHKKHDKVSPQPAAPVCAADKQLVGAACVCKSRCAVNQTQNPESCACTVNPVPQSCAPPKVGTPPNCACPVSSSCTPGQQIYNQVTCQCDTVMQPVTCPNSLAAPNNNLSLCAKCSDGSFQTTSPCPGEGGTGNNCPSGDCNSGAPPAAKTQK